jgi:hypothetical protein
VVLMGEGRGVSRVLDRRPKGKTPLGRPRCRWEDNIKMDLREIEIDGFCDHGNEPLGSIKKQDFF